MRSHAVALALVSLVALAGCSTYRDQLVRAQRAFETNDHPKTVGLLRELEPDLARLSTTERAQYAYLRGMSDYRIGYRADARHWLSIAKTYDDVSVGVLPNDWKLRMNEALGELNGVVYTDGHPALSALVKPGEGPR